jgi:hypothetical protein
MAPFDLAIFTAMCLATTARGGRGGGRSRSGLSSLVGNRGGHRGRGVGVNDVARHSRLEDQPQITGYVIETIPG